MALGGYGVYHREAAAIRADKAEDLASISRLKAEAIQAWREERLADAAELSHSPLFRAAVARLLQNPKDASFDAVIADRLRLAGMGSTHAAVLLAAPGGQTLAAWPAQAPPLDPQERAAVRQALAAKLPLFCDLHRAPDPPLLRMDVLSALTGNGEEAQTVLVMRIDPATALFPLIQSWPVYRKSAESLIIRRDGDRVVSLNNLRFKPDSALNFSVPLSRTELPAVQAVLGRTGVFEGRDYRGIMVLSDIQPIPGSPWFLVSKVDRAEIYAGAIRWAYALARVIMLLVLLAGLATGYLYKHQGKRVYQRLYRSERERREALEEFSATLRGIGDGVIATDTDGRVRLMNPVAETLTGWSEAEAQGRPLAEVFRIINEQTRAEVESPVDKVLREGSVVGLANHTMLIAKGGAERPIADSGAPVRGEDGALLGVVLVFRDQTKERAAQEALRESEEQHRSLIEGAPVGIFVTTAEGKVLSVNPALARMLGLQSPRAARAYYTDLGTQLYVHPEARQEFLRRLKDAGRVEEFEYEARTADGRIVWLAMNARLAGRQEDGALRIEGFTSDVTARKEAEKALQDRAELFRHLFTDGPAPKLILDPEDGRIVDANKAAERFYGWTADRLKTMSAFDLNTLPPDEVRLKMAHVRDEQENHFYFRHRLASGEVRDVEVFSGPIRVGGKTLFFSIIHDITKRRLAEEALRESEERFRGLYENLSLGLYRSTPDGRILMANPALLRMLGYDSFEELARRNLETEQAYEPDYPRLIFKEKIERDGVVQGLESAWKRTDGTTIFVRESARLVRDGEGTPLFYEGTAEDITARINAEAESRWLASILEQSLNEIYVFDARSLRFTYANGGALANLGFSLEEFQALTPVDIKPLISREALDALLEPLRSGKQGRLDLETVHRRKDGSTYPVLLTLQRSTQGGQDVIVAIGYDITDRQHLEDQLRQAQKMESVGRLAGGVAHDFNNMLNIIMIYTELALRRLGPDAPMRADLDEVQKAAKRSATLTKQLLAFARKQQILPRVLDLNATVAEMVKMLSRLLGEDIAFGFYSGAGLWPVKMDPGQVDQILANLAVNARDAIEGAGTVTLETSNLTVDEAYLAAHPYSEPGDYVLMTFSDTGRGMDRETLDKIFEPFFSTKGSLGTGLGLSTVYGIVKQNRGFINAYSEVGRGTTFKIYIPRWTGENETEAHASEAPAPRGAETVLVAEDEEAILALTGRLLREQGYTVLSAPSPSDALLAAQQHEGPIHLLLTDVVMPLMNGKELAERLTALRPEIKVLYMSGYTANVVAHRGVLDEGVHFLQKPFSMESLARAVRDALDGKG